MKIHKKVELWTDLEGRTFNKQYRNGTRLVNCLGITDYFTSSRTKKRSWRQEGKSNEHFGQIFNDFLFKTE